MSSSSTPVGKRNFVITSSSIGFKGGKYSANKSGTPLSAAHRAARIIFRMAKNEKGKAAWKKFESDDKLVKFTIRETTRGSEKNEYQYEAKIKDLAHPKTVKRAGVEYQVTTELVVRAAKYTPLPFGGTAELELERSG